MSDVPDHATLMTFAEKIKSAVDLAEDRVETAVVLEAVKLLSAHDGSLMAEKAPQHETEE